MKLKKVFLGVTNWSIFWSKLIQLFTFHSVSIIDCIKTDIYLQTFKTFTLYKSVQSKNYSNTFYEAHIYNTL